MRDTLYTRTLVQAAEVEGSTQALAHLLKVPESTLLRWLSGHAQMPLRAFIKAVDLLSEHEKGNGSTLTGKVPPAGQPLEFSMGELRARCPRCDSMEFAQKEPDTPLRMTSRLVCARCGDEIIHGNLIVQLATDVVQHGRALTAARTKRQSSLPKRANVAPSGQSQPAKSGEET